MRLVNRKAVVIAVCAVLVSPATAHHKSTDNDDEQVVSTKKRTELLLIEHNKELLRAYDAFKEKVAQQWGGEAVVPDAKLDVIYRDELRQRSVVNFEDGTVAVELLIDTAGDEDPVVLGQKLSEAIRQTIYQPPDNRSIIEIAEEPTPPLTDEAPMLEGLVAAEDGQPISAQDIEDFSSQQARSMMQRWLKGNDGVERLVVSAEFKLVPDHIRVRAAKYKDDVDHHAQVHNIPPPLIYAIMETESFFNPTAKSPVPAFGLMQLVPETGARDAYKFLFSKDVVVKEQYLYKPNKNIELGVAYLHMLYYRYLRQIKDPGSRLWATIAAYNTGVQNVIKSFSGEYETGGKYSSRLIWKHNAITQINKLKPEQVYTHLRQYLPASETRDYIKKVRERMGKYNT